MSTPMVLMLFQEGWKKCPSKYLTSENCKLINLVFHYVEFVVYEAIPIPIQIIMQMHYAA